MVILVRQDRSEGSLRAYTVQELPWVAQRVQAAGIEAVKLFAADQAGSSGIHGEDPGSVMARAIRIIKRTCPRLQVWTETCLCSHLPSGECHLSKDGRPDEAGTIAALSRQAVAQAAAGADVVGPAAMVPGSVEACRRALCAAGLGHVGVMPHLIMCSGLYSGYRATMGITPPAESRRFQLPVGGHTAAAVERGLLMLAEGANALLIEPALFSADILAGLRARTDAPLVAFSVSGECAALPPAILAEEYTMLLRAGASRVASHAALTVADTLSDRPSHRPTTGKPSP
ncbi:hypothetical protein [Thermomonospora echinospora]|nr:hypothetical protein [Thermomonospora echinospora]